MDFIPVNEPSLDGNELKYLQECIETGWISSEGPFVERFETSFATTVQRKYGVAVCNGSVALDVAIHALGIGPGDEVIMPTFTIISCASAIVRAGAMPVVVDCDAETWNMDVAQVESKISEKTKAIMVVHIYGLPTDMDPVLDLAKKYRLKIIEDAAEAIGLNYKGQPCGSFGDVSVFSFYPNKHVTTGEGGMVVTNDKTIADKSRSLRNLCFDNSRRFVHEELGWNYRMTNLQAALGLAQLEKLDDHMKRKKEIGALYSDLLKGLNGVQLPLNATTYAENVYWVFGMVLGESLPIDGRKAIALLVDQGVGCRPFFWPMNKQPVFLKMGLFNDQNRCAVAEGIAERGFYLPSGLALTDDQIIRVSKTVSRLFSELG